MILATGQRWKYKKFGCIIELINADKVYNYWNCIIVDTCGESVLPVGMKRSYLDKRFSGKDSEFEYLVGQDNTRGIVGKKKSK
jgi:hypothetical protein